VPAASRFSLRVIPVVERDAGHDECDACNVHGRRQLTENDHPDLRSIDELGGVLDRFLPYGETSTSLRVRYRKPRRAPPSSEPDTSHSSNGSLAPKTEKSPLSRIAVAAPASAFAATHVNAPPTLTR
jgi:hypothetical protein